MFRKILSHPYTKLLAFFVSYVWFTAFSNAVLPVFFLKSGLSFEQITFGMVLNMLGQVCAIYILTNLKWSNRKLWTTSLLMHLAVFSSYIIYPEVHTFFVTSFVAGMASLIFYGTYNISHFKLVPTHKNGFGASIFFNLLTIIGIAAPVVSGIVAAISFQVLLGVSFIFALLPAYFIRKQEPILIDFGIKRALFEVRFVKYILVLHGFQEALTYGIIPIYTLMLIQDPVDFGAFGSIVKFATVFLGFVIGGLSDKLKDKKHVLAFFVTLVGIVTLFYSLPFVHATVISLAFIGLAYGMISSLYNQVALAFIMDKTTDRVHAIFGRELLMNVGRFLGMILVFVGFLFRAFLPFSVVILALGTFLSAFLVLRTKQGNISS